ncbi:hypothetical protein K491DRAFT_504337 [Lophiostoma macrostomum CBS 122681]|uniref:Uncharacterized protein n=1 Tax=Lophiostoma macrostomum CBS 122681 TaxID=1314788 RepID=A0A6A6TM80_9PLEO|nr:hypothetical protein K491DRAFT_504337 [Lophiostoma macrostomum CBS 122681]
MPSRRALAGRPSAVPSRLLGGLLVLRRVVQGREGREGRWEAQQQLNARGSAPKCGSDCCSSHRLLGAVGATEPRRTGDAPQSLCARSRRRACAGLGMRCVCQR